MGEKTKQRTLTDLIDIVRNKSSDIFIWLAYNILIGSLSVWIGSILFLIGKPDFDWLADIKKGTLLIFITTLIGTSMGFFAEVTKKHFWNTRRFLFIGLLLTLIVSMFLYPLVSVGAIKNALKIDDYAVISLSILLFILATFLCLVLYLMRLSIEEEDAYSLSREQEKEVKQLTEEAQKKKIVDGIKL